MQFPALKILLLFALLAFAGALSIDIAKAKSNFACASLGSRPRSASNLLLTSL